VMARLASRASSASWSDGMVGDVSVRGIALSFAEDHSASTQQLKQSNYSERERDMAGPILACFAGLEPGLLVAGAVSSI
jgi:hypothetical protein